VGAISAAVATCAVPIGDIGYKLPILFSLITGASAFGDPAKSTWNSATQS